MAEAPKLIALPRVDSLRDRILVFAILATLIPSGVTMGISYVQSRRAVEGRITRDLRLQATQASREMGVWVKERLYDLRVFASSYEVTDQLDRFARGATGAPTQGRLADYLKSLHERFRDYERLVVVDAQGRVVSTSASTAGPVHLPEGWVRTMKQDNRLVGDPYWDDKAGAGKVIIAVPIKRPDGNISGAFAAELNLAPLRDLLRSFATDSTGAVYLLSLNGSLVASSRLLSANLLRTALSQPTLDRLSAREHQSVNFRNASGTDVLGTMERVAQVRWAVVAERPADEAFAEVERFRDIGLFVLVVLLLLVSWLAYRLSGIIVRPLDRLAQAAAEVAAGDLAVDLPPGGAGEVGRLTTTFNEMVARLRANREALERLTVTDGLTGLSNRRFLEQRLNEEAQRTGRTSHAFTVMMADIDNFKQFNDTFGHPAGDEVLKAVGRILRESARAMDCVVRYGGEEFCVLLPVTTVGAAKEFADRVCSKLESERFNGRVITLSVGIAAFPADSPTPDGVISAADGALYEAKRAGRNRIVVRKGPPGSA